MSNNNDCNNCGAIIKEVTPHVPASSLSPEHEKKVVMMPSALSYNPHAVPSSLQREHGCVMPPEYAEDPNCPFTHLEIPPALEHHVYDEKPMDEYCYVEYLQPAESPTLREIQIHGFEDALVTIEADIACQTEPLTEVDCPCDEPEEECKPDCCPVGNKPVCFNDCAEKTFKTAGAPVDAKLLDALPASSMTLLGRCAKRIARLTGEGYLYLDGQTGKVNAAKTIKLTVTQLWHKFHNPGGCGQLVVGPPLGVDYLAVVAADGCVYAVKGLENCVSVMMYDPTIKKWAPQCLDALPFHIKSRLPSAECLELTGFEAVPVGGSHDTVRVPKRLCGEGILYLKKIDTAPDDSCECAPEPMQTCVVCSLPCPESTACDDGPFVLQCERGELSWVSRNILKGEPGEPGQDGEPGECGPQGPMGPEGARGTQTYSVSCKCP